MKKTLFLLLILFYLNTFGLDLKRVLIFGSDEKKEYLFFKPGPLIVDKKGNIFVAEGETQVIRKYSKAGVFLKEIGKKGQGPQEFMGMTSFFMQGSFILVYDYLSKRLSKYSLDLEYIDNRIDSSINLFVASNQEYVIANKKERNKNEIAVTKPFEKWEKIVFNGEDFGIYEKYRNTPLFSFFFSYLFAVEEKSGSFVATMWHPLTDEPQLVYFDRSGKLLRTIRVKVISDNYSFDRRLFDRATFKKATGKKLNIGRLFYVNESHTAFQYAYGSNKSDTDTGLLFVDSFSGKIIAKYKNIKNYDIRCIRDEHAYGFKYDEKDAGIKIEVKKILW